MTGYQAKLNLGGLQHSWEGTDHPGRATAFAGMLSPSWEGCSLPGSLITLPGG